MKIYCIPRLYRTFIYLFAFLAPWFAWSLVREYKTVASSYLYSNVWAPLRLHLSGGPWQNRGMYCYKETNSVIIFLHVTNASEQWSPIEACAFKLAAVHNNDTGVCVLTVYPMDPHPMLTRIPNLEISPLDYVAIFNDTPLAQWYDKYIVKNSRPSAIWMWEISDALRYAYLYKYGGKYMDTDSWTLKNLAPLQNVVGWQDGGLLANGVMFFEKGNPFIQAIMDNFTRYFLPGSFGSTGPYLITIIHRKNIVDNSTYKAVDRGVFYPTHYSQNHYPFIANHKGVLMGMIKNSYALHLWRYMIRKWYDKPPPNGSYIHDTMSTICKY